MDAEDDDDEDLNYYGCANDGIENQKYTKGQIPFQEDTGDTEEAQEEGLHDALDQITHVPDLTQTPFTQGMQLCDRSDIIYASDIELLPGTTLTSSEKEDR